MTVRLIGACAGSALAFGLSACGPSANTVAPNASAEAAPNFSGNWARQAIGLEPPSSGPGPVVKVKLLAGEGISVVGDHTNPILNSAAAEMVKRRGDAERRGEVLPDPSNQCWPLPPLFGMSNQLQMQILQQQDQVTIVNMSDQQVRRVRLSGEHPAHVTPSWSGDSVGHFDGKTLVVDTIGMKVGPFPMVDPYGTPQSEALHIIERYQLVDYEAAKEAGDRAEEEQGYRVESELFDGVMVDHDYKGKGLQVQITVEDKNVFTTPWSGTLTYRRAAREWMERVCAENLRESNGKDRKVPTADKPDF